VNKWGLSFVLLIVLGLTACGQKGDLYRSDTLASKEGGYDAAKSSSR
jgi:predicted small lipoprotein YifL